MEKMFTPAVSSGENAAAENKESVLEKELTLEEKKSLSQMWVDLVVDCEKVPADMENFSNAEIKAWMFQSMMHDARRLLLEWRLEPDEMKIKNIVMADNLEIKAQLEKEYVLQMHDKITQKAATFQESEGSSRWSSWPKAMREQNLFNCVGAAVLGAEILESAGIETYYANPVGHVVNLVKLASGEWWYVDFRNGETQCKKIDPQEISITDVPVLKIDDPMIDYQLLPYGDNSEIIAFVLGNFLNMDNESDDDSIDEDNRDKIYAKEYIAKNKNKLMPTEQLGNVFEKMFTHIKHLRESEAMQSERIRIRNIHGVAGESAKDFLKSLTNQEEAEVLAELQEKFEMLQRLWRSGDESFYQTASENSIELVRRISRQIERAEGERKEGIIEEVQKQIRLYNENNKR
jgi:hypothetical protein